MERAVKQIDVEIAGHYLQLAGVAVYLPTFYTRVDSVVAALLSVIYLLKNPGGILQGQGRINQLLGSQLRDCYLMRKIKAVLMLVFKICYL